MQKTSLVLKLQNYYLTDGKVINEQQCKSSHLVTTLLFLAPGNLHAYILTLRYN